MRRSTMTAKSRSPLTVVVVAVLAWGGLTLGAQQPTASSASPSGVTKQQFDQCMKELSNWGRWGKDDERGALNLITVEKQRLAATLVKTGTAVSLAHPIV